MVKNYGGNKAKGYARKDMIKGSNSLKISEDPNEIYAQTVKISGGSICRVTDLNGTEMNCHIRGKFRGRGKRDNLIVPGTWLLVGLREWEKEASQGKLLNCDLIEVYTESDKVRLKNSVTNVNWTSFIANDAKTISTTITEKNQPEDDIVFADDKTQEYQSLIEAHIAQSNAGSSSSVIITTDDGKEIDVDDI
jgi:translation initiation factor IF-1